VRLIYSMGVLSLALVNCLGISMEHADSDDDERLGGNEG
jgi:hypothetical protein